MSEDHTNTQPSDALRQMFEGKVMKFGMKFGAHKPEPDEATEPTRTRGSLPASTGQSESEAAAVQLAPVLCPQDFIYNLCGACLRCDVKAVLDARWSHVAIVSDLM